jgi:DNA replication and repair protein RecF
MGLKRLNVEGFRCFERAELEPAPGLNLVTGLNASGKTSLLEAIFMLGRGRSFRASRREVVIRERSEQARVIGQVTDGRTLGLEVRPGGWSASIAGEPVTQLAELAEMLPVQVLDPEIHRLVQEGPGERRRYLDWATFHVKPGFLDTWRRYQRALKQRNSALKSGSAGSTLASWEAALAETGPALDRMRAETVAELAEPVRLAGQRLLGADLHLSYRPGQPDSGDFAAALAAHRDRDRRAGMTQIGPHRADLVLTIDDHKAKGWVSRGQQKLVASALVLGQAERLAACWGDRAILLVDDPAAELDREHCAALLGLVAALPFQTFLTAMEAEAVAGIKAAQRFHVEQGRIAQVV